MNDYNIDSNTSYCLGMSLTIEALLHKADFVKKVVLSNRAEKNKQLDLLFELCNKNSIDIDYDDNLISKLSIKENCYCIGIFDKYYSELKDNNHVVLYGFNDYGELGTVLRSCVSFDYKDIVLIDCSIDYFDPRCVRASMGSIFHCNVRSFDSLDSYINEYRNNIYSFVSKSDKQLSDLRLNEPYSLVLSQNYYGLDNMFENSYCIHNKNDNEISLSIRSSIILETAYYLKRNL